MPHTAMLPQIAENACGVLVPQIAMLPHTAPVPQTAQFAFRNTDVPHTAIVPQTAELPQTAMLPETVPVPHTAIMALGSRDTVPDSSFSNGLYIELGG